MEECEQELSRVRELNVKYRNDIEEQKQTTKAIQDELAASFQQEHDQLLENARITHTHLKKARSDNQKLLTSVGMRQRCFCVLLLIYI